MPFTQERRCRMRSEAGPNSHKLEFEFELDFRERHPYRATVGGNGAHLG